MVAYSTHTRNYMCMICGKFSLSSMPPSFDLKTIETLEGNWPRSLHQQQSILVDVVEDITTKTLYIISIISVIHEIVSLKQYMNT